MLKGGRLLQFIVCAVHYKPNSQASLSKERLGRRLPGLTQQREARQENKIGTRPIRICISNTNHAHYVRMCDEIRDSYQYDKKKWERSTMPVPRWYDVPGDFSGDCVPFSPSINFCSETE